MSNVKIKYLHPAIITSVHSIVMSMLVCLSVCSYILKITCLNFTKLSYMLRIAVARSSSGSMIQYVYVPQILWFDINGPKACDVYVYNSTRRVTVVLGTHCNIGSKRACGSLWETFHRATIHQGLITRRLITRKPFNCEDYSPGDYSSRD